jgi:hypothetical protein
MGRTYGGILGPLGFGMFLARGLIHASGTESTLVGACIALFALALVGYLAGSLADYLVAESVRTQFQSALAAFEAPAN